MLFLPVGGLGGTLESFTLPPTSPLTTEFVAVPMHASTSYTSSTSSLGSLAIPAQGPKQAITVLQYNIWFADYEVERRMEELGHIIAECNPDIIALEEVKPEILEDHILNQKTFRSYYISDDSKGSTLGRYGVLLLSKFKFQNLYISKMPSRLNRSTVVGEFDIPVGYKRDESRGKELHYSRVAVAIAHLESYPEDVQWRYHQLRVMMNLLHKNDNAIMMMDSNIREEDEDLIVLKSKDVPILTPKRKKKRRSKKAGGEGPNDKVSAIEGGFRDSWRYCKEKRKVHVIQEDVDHPGDVTLDNMQGYTRDYTRNKMVKKKERLRLDRVYVKSGVWEPSNFKIVGTNPISGLQDVYPSDHFGVCVQLQWKGFTD
eukprot:TRINITY_DN2258_c0_g1_i1.p1 TRINITY_DN2258_c0_g1~~TRINITY_DN2258_c0_g1_i1.p1  ORF type:complete len:372 (-),score=79.44 TRINITY_DN2258_c0_g1_i1:51-1166(-)